MAKFLERKKTLLDASSPKSCFFFLSWLNPDNLTSDEFQGVVAIQALDTKIY
jgi:hypothetical protein